MNDLEILELTLRRVASENRTNYDMVRINNAFKQLADRLGEARMTTEDTSDADMPSPPWPPGSSNAQREGWTSFFCGYERGTSPFPADRTDLHAKFLEGWDAAQLVKYPPLPAKHPVLQALEEARTQFAFYEAEHYRKAREADERGDAMGCGASTHKARTNGDLCAGLYEVLARWTAPEN